MVNAKSTQNRHEDELTLIFDKLYVFQEGFLQNTLNMTERVDIMEASTLPGSTDQGSSQLEALEEHIYEMEKDRISDRLHIDGLESRLNAGNDGLAIGEMIVHSTEDLKAHMVEVQGEAINLGVLFSVYNILTRIQQHIKGEETMAEVMKHNKVL